MSLPSPFAELGESMSHLNPTTGGTADRDRIPIPNLAANGAVPSRGSENGGRCLPTCQCLNSRSDEEIPFRQATRVLQGSLSLQAIQDSSATGIQSNPLLRSVSHPLTPPPRMYLLQILQQPATGAEHGSYVLSRLPLSPPLVLQFMVFNHEGAQVIM